MRETTFTTGTKEELKWLLKNLNSDATSTSTIIAFCNVMAEYFSKGWMLDASPTGWKDKIFPKIKDTSMIIMQINDRWKDLYNIFPPDKIDEQEEAAMKADIEILFSVTQDVLFLSLAEPNEKIKVALGNFSISLKSFAKVLSISYPSLLIAVSVANKIAEGGLSFINFNQLQHHKN